MRLIWSIVMSIAASLLGTYLLRQVVPAPPAEESTAERPPSVVNVVVVVPVIAGNGWSVGTGGALFRLLGRRKRGARRLRTTRLLGLSR